MRKLTLVILFFAIAPVFLILNLLLATSITHQKNDLILLNFKAKPKVVYAALPTTQTTIQEEIIEEDARVEIVKQFFIQYGSPLEDFAKNVVQNADHYNLDYRFVPAIAMQESNLCKKSPKDSYNCWGFGIYGGKVTRFENYPQAIETVTKTLALKYKNNGLDSPEEIMKKYTPSNNGDWAKSVTYFMERLQ